MPRLLVTDSGGVERESKRLLVVDSGGTTRKLKRLFVVDSGGTSRLVFSGALFGGTVLLTNQSDSEAIDPILGASAGVTFAQDGNVYLDNGGDVTGEWAATGAASDAGLNVEVKATLVSGATPDGPTLGAWHVCEESTGGDPTTGPRWSLFSPGGGSTKASVFDVEMRDRGSQEVLDSARYTVETTL